MVSDLDLYGRWQAGRDAEAFAELVARHGGMVYGVCRRVLGNASDAEDVAQQCFVELAESRGSVRRSLGGWLHAMAVHRSRDRLRTEWRRRRRETRYAEDLPQTVAPPADDLGTVVDEAIVRLPEELRSAVVHRFLEGHTQQETADLLGVSRSTAQYRIEKGVERIREHLGRRGVPAVVAASALTEGVVEAAPPGLTAALGKVAMAGGTTLASAKTAGVIAAGGLLMTVKKAALGGGIALLLAGLWYGVTPAPPASTATTPTEASPVESTPAVQESGEAPAATAAPTPQSGQAGVDREAVAAQPAAAASPETAAGAKAAGGLRLAGQVFVTGSTPAAGARIALTQGEATQRQPSGTATADVEGRFVVENLAAGNYNVTARGSEGGYAQALNVPAGTEGVKLVLSETARVSGRAYDRETGEGVPGALIVVIPVGSVELRPAILGLFHTQDQRSDAQGRYVMDVPAPAQYALAVVDAQQYLDEDWNQRAPFRVEPRQHAEHMDIGLRRGLAVAGTVYDSADKPVAGADVQLLNQVRGSNAPDAVTVTDAEGRYRMEKALPGQAYVVRASHADYGSVESQPVTLSPGGERVDVDLQFVEGHRLSGRVVTSDGQGVPGLPVWVAGAREGDFVAVPYMRATTGEDGAFAIGPLTGGEYVLTADLSRSPAGRSEATFRSSPFTMPADADLDDFEMDIGPALEGSIAGTLTGPEGEPVAGATVGAHSPNAHCFTQSGADGSYRIEYLGSSERWAIEVFTTSAYAHDARHDVPVGSEDVDFVLRRRGSVSGIVVDEATGKPVPAFEVREVPWPATPFSSPDGTFALTGIQGAAPVLEVSAEGYVAATTEPIELDERGAAAGIRIALKPGEGVEGVVIDLATGQPLEGARVCVFEGRLDFAWYARGQGWSERDPITDAQGAFTLYGLPPGEPANLLAWRQGYAPAVLPGTTEGHVTIALGVGGSIQGTVTRGGQPLANARVFMERAPFDDGFSYNGHAVTSSQGAFQASHLPPGDYRVICASGIGGEGPLWVGDTVVEEGKATEVVVLVGEGPQP